MAALTVATEIDAPPEQVWEDVADIASHVEWMHDAAAIRITSESTEGVGTTFDCDTVLGPFRLTDHMEITSWRPGAEMGVRHVGVVTGSGTFTLTPVPDLGDPSGRVQTRFEWTEELTFPWHLGGPLGAVVARPLLRRVWTRNLTNLARRFSG